MVAPRPGTPSQISTSDTVLPAVLAKPTFRFSTPELAMREPMMAPLALNTSCEFLSCVANTRRAFSASMKLALLKAVPVGISTAVRLVEAEPQLAQWLSWLVAGATWKPRSRILRKALS